jgi:poly(3-hydroxybutyrate) depolymerase
MSNETFNQNYLVVYPRGIHLVWQGDPDATGHDDVDFTLSLLANLSSTFCVDSSRVYAAGKSSGGGFAVNILACDPRASLIFAAFGGMSGACYQGLAGATENNCNGATVPVSCNQGRYPVLIFTIHGSADATINYDGGPRRNYCLPSLPHFMTSRSTLNHLGGSNTSTTLNKATLSASITVMTVCQVLTSITGFTVWAMFGHHSPRVATVAMSIS